MSDHTASAPSIDDVDESSFATAVVEASHTRPVVVDFWAAWCAPCRQLSPLLERVAARHADDVAVVKVDVDAAPRLAARYRVQGIPSVKAFRDGAVVAEFTGLQPEAAVERFFAALAPTPADRLAAQAETAPPTEQEALLRAALEEQPDHPAACVALARLLRDRGDADEARRLLDRVPADAAARRLFAELQLSVDAPTAAELDDLRSHAAAGDGDARLALGRALAAGGDAAAALPVLIDAVREPATRDAARAAVLEVFAVLGDDSDLVRAWRPRLASALF